MTWRAVNVLCWIGVAALLGTATSCATSPRTEKPQTAKERQARHRPAAPEEGAPAPNFKLKTRDRSREVELASFRGEKPVVLVFGSYT